MKEYNDYKIIGIDHGYGNIKTANTVTHTGIIKYDSKPLFSGHVLEYAGSFYRIGENHKEFVPDKVQDEDYYIMTLFGIARELNIAKLTSADVILAAGLPLNWMRSQRESFRSYLLQNKDVEFVYNDKQYHVRFVDCLLYPQCYPAVVTELRNFGGITLVADIGNGTLNILHIANKKVKEERCRTEKLGVNQCMIRAKNAVMDKYAVKIDDTIVEQVFRTGKADIAPQYQNCIVETAQAYVQEIFDTLKRYEYNPDLMRLYVVGGGGCLVKNFGTYDSNRVTIQEDICATAKGFETLAFAELNKRSRR